MRMVTHTATQPPISITFWMGDTRRAKYQLVIQRTKRDRGTENQRHERKKERKKERKIAGAQSLSISGEIST